MCICIPASILLIFIKNLLARRLLNFKQHFFNFIFIILLSSLLFKLFLKISPSELQFTRRAIAITHFL